MLLGVISKTFFCFLHFIWNQYRSKVCICALKLASKLKPELSLKVFFSNEEIFEAISTVQWLESAIKLGQALKN